VPIQQAVDEVTQRAVRWPLSLAVGAGSASARNAAMSGQILRSLPRRVATSPHGTGGDGGKNRRLIAFITSVSWKAPTPIAHDVRLEPAE
jgi:hypothetical protein